MLLLKKLTYEAATLSTPLGRLFTWFVLTIVIFISPFHWLGNLSFWQSIGWDSAPSIGLTRAYWLLLHGQFSAALERNGLILPVVLTGGILLTVDIVRITRGRQRSAKVLN